MRRVSFYAPRGRLLYPQVLRAFQLLGMEADRDVVSGWSQLELVLAYDWAMRHCLRASDNYCKTRPRPSFIPDKWGRP